MVYDLTSSYLRVNLEMLQLEPTGIASPYFRGGTAPTNDDSCADAA